MKEVKHKLISVVVAIVLIVLIVIIAFGKQIKTSMDNGEEINGRWFLALVYPDKYASQRLSSSTPLFPSR